MDRSASSKCSSATATYQSFPTPLYARANRGEVVDVSGLDAPYETPASPEILLETVTMTVDDNVERILAHLRTARLLL